MEKSLEKTKNKKASLVKRAAWTAGLYFTIFATSLILIIKRQIPFTAEDYLAPIPLPIFINKVSLVLLIVVGVLFIRNTILAEKDDELSILNRYKAGYIAFFIFIFAIIITIYIMKNFEFVLEGYYPGDISFSLGLVIWSFALFLQNIIFIILEKTNLE